MHVYNGQVPIRDMSNLNLGCSHQSDDGHVFAKQIGDNNNVNRTDC